MGHDTPRLERATARNYVDPGESCRLEAAVVYEPSIDAYCSSLKKTLLKRAMIDIDQAFAVGCGDIKSLFPEYDPSMHVIEYPALSSFSKNTIMVAELYEYSSSAKNEIPPGFYEVAMHCDYGTILKNRTVITDTYIDIGRDQAQSLYKLVTDWKNSVDVYKKEGGRHRESALAFGSPGQGKTMEICRVLQDSHKEDLISIYIPSGFRDLGDLSHLRTPLKGKFVVFVIEELTERACDSYYKEALLSFLDGEMSWDNCFIISTTNHPESLPIEVVDRPGRFNELLKFDSPNRESRMKYLLGRNVPLVEAEIAADLSKDLSIDYLAHAVTNSRVKGRSVSDHLKAMKTSRTIVTKNFKNSVGFGRDDE